MLTMLPLKMHSAGCSCYCKAYQHHHSYLYLKQLITVHVLTCIFSQQWKWLDRLCLTQSTTNHKAVCQFVICSNILILTCGLSVTVACCSFQDSRLWNHSLPSENAGELSSQMVSLDFNSVHHKCINGKGSCSKVRGSMWFLNMKAFKRNMSGYYLNGSVRLIAVETALLTNIRANVFINSLQMDHFWVCGCNV